MNAQTPIVADNLAIWRAVERTDPSHTKRVNQRGGFTAISAHYQVMRATEQFGPVGIGWGYVNGDPIWHENLVIVPVTLWHGERSNTFGPVFGGAEWRNAKGFIDSDAPKKAATDGMTKGLSQLGFNADVFMGRFDDNKYIQQMEREFAAQDAANDAAGGQSGKGAQSAPGSNLPSTGEPAPRKREKLEGPYTSATALKSALHTFIHELNGCGDSSELQPFLDLKDSRELIAQVQRDKPDWWEGWPEQPDGFTPLRRLIEMREYECAQATAAYATA